MNFKIQYMKLFQKGFLPDAAAAVDQYIRVFKQFHAFETIIPALFPCFLIRLYSRKGAIPDS